MKDKSKSDFSNFLIENLGSNPIKAVRLNIANIEVDFLKFIDRPYIGCTTYISNGINTRLLRQISGIDIHQEIIFTIKNDQNDIDYLPLLSLISSRLIISGMAIKEGEVINYEGFIFPMFKLKSLLCCSPLYFPENLHVYNDTNGFQTILVWLVPLFIEECNFIENNGWIKFQELILKMDPPLEDLSRASIIKE